MAKSKLYDYVLEMVRTFLGADQAYLVWNAKPNHSEADILAALRELVDDGEVVLVQGAFYCSLQIDNETDAWLARTGASVGYGPS